MGILIAYLLGILTAKKTFPDSHKSQRLPAGQGCVICVPPVDSKEEETEKKNIKRRKTITFRVEMASAFVLFIYAVFTALIYCATKKAADAAKSAADTASKQLELAERPWVDTAIAIDGPLVWNVNGMNVTVKVATRNIGNSPALSVFSSPLLLVGANAENASNYRAHVCENADNATRHGDLGVALFPNGSPVERQYSTSIGNNEIEQQKASKEFPGSNFGKVVLSPTLVICTTYRPTFNSKTVYHTAYIVDLFKINSAAGIVPAFNIGEDVDKSQLSLRFHVFDAIAAD